MQLIAHRGGAGLGVENTRAAFEHAIALGAEGAELDVQLTRDDQVMVHHDARLNDAYCRDEAGNWLASNQVSRIADLTWSELQALRNWCARPRECVCPDARLHRTCRRTKDSAVA